MRAAPRIAKARSRWAQPSSRSRKVGGGRRRGRMAVILAISRAIADMAVFACAGTSRPHFDRPERQTMTSFIAQSRSSNAQLIQFKSLFASDRHVRDHPRAQLSAMVVPQFRTVSDAAAAPSRRSQPFEPALSRRKLTGRSSPALMAASHPPAGPCDRSSSTPAVACPCHLQSHRVPPPALQSCVLPALVVPLDRLIVGCSLSDRGAAAI